MVDFKARMARSKMLLSCRLRSTNPGHTIIAVYQHGGLAGELTVETRVVGEVVERISNGLQYFEDGKIWTNVTEE